MNTMPYLILSPIVITKFDVEIPANLEGYIVLNFKSRLLKIKPFKAKNVCSVVKRVLEQGKIILLLQLGFINMWIEAKCDCWVFEETLVFSKDPFTGFLGLKIIPDILNKIAQAYTQSNQECP